MKARVVGGPCDKREIDLHRDNPPQFLNLPVFPKENMIFKEGSKPEERSIQIALYKIYDIQYDVAYYRYVR